MTILGPECRDRRSMIARAVALVRVGLGFPGAAGMPTLASPAPQGVGLGPSLSRLSLPTVTNLPRHSRVVERL